MGPTLEGEESRVEESLGDSADESLGDGPFRKGVRPSLLPLVGGRSVMLPRTTTRATRIAWGVVALVVLGPLVGVPIAAALSADNASMLSLGVKLVLGVILTGVIAVLRVDRHSARWVVHFDDTTTVLEDRRTKTALALTSENTRLGAFGVAADTGSASPTVVIDDASTRLIIGAQRGVVVAAESAALSGLPHVVAPQPAVWKALSDAAARPRG